MSRHARADAMPSPAKPDGLEPLRRMPPNDLNAVLERARSLQLQAQADALQALLRGRKLGLLCETDESADAALFRRAAVELGAYVAHIRPNLSEVSSVQEVQRTARILGRLYDAVECQGLASTLVEQLGHEAGVPFFDAIASPRHPSARLARRLGGHVPAADRRRIVLQAVLLSVIV